MPVRHGLGSIWHGYAKPFLKPAFWVCAGKLFISDNFYDATWITGESMAPSLNPHYHETGQCDWVIWKKWNPCADLKRGDIVHFSTPPSSEQCSVKRVIALEGDTVLLNPTRRPRRERDGADLPESRGWDAYGGRAKVPAGHVWVEGDNWRNTRDSNWYGPISKSLITGKAVAVLLPYDKMGTKPWQGFRSRTKVIEGKVDRETEFDVLRAIEKIESG